MLLAPLRDKKRVPSRPAMKPPLPALNKQNRAYKVYVPIECKRIPILNIFDELKPHPLQLYRRRSTNSSSTTNQSSLRISFTKRPESESTADECPQSAKQNSLSFKSHSRMSTTHSQGSIKRTDSSKLKKDLSNINNTSAFNASQGRTRFELVHSDKTYETERALTGKLSSKAWIAYDMDSRLVVYEKKGFAKRQMASITKIMTCLVALETMQQLQLDPKRLICTVSRRAAEINGTSAGLQIGTRISLYDLLYAMMLPSGNDAALAIAQSIGSILCCREFLIMENSLDSLYDAEGFENRCKLTKRSVGAFLQEMNRKALILNMTRTQYGNPHGLSQKNNYSTCEDLVRLCEYLIDTNKEFMKIVGTQKYTATCHQTQKIYTWQNTHKLLAEGWKGIKTGVTPNAGPCLSSYYKGKDGHLIIILLDCRSMEARYQQTKLLLETWKNQPSS